MLITIENRFTGENIISGEFTSLKKACEANRNKLQGADLHNADLQDIDLRGAKLQGADLRGADLQIAKNYADSHDFFEEIVRRQPVNSFNSNEWGAIAQITIHTLCWDSINKRFDNEARGIFAKLAETGFTEWKEGG